MLFSCSEKMQEKGIRLLLLLATLPVASFGYRIDAGCGSDTAFVRSTIDSAFAAAAVGVSALTANPVNPSVDQVFRQLFGRNIANVAPEEQSMQNGLAALGAISGYNADVGAANTDVTFYCTTDRIKKRTTDDGTVEYYNSALDIVYGPDITSKWAHCFDLLSPTLAITTNPGQIAGNPTGSASEIQICPWLLTQQRGYKFRDFKSANALLLGSLSKVVMPIYRRVEYAPIDAFSLFDKVLLHELTHITQGGISVDMDPEPYGWKNCKALADIWVASGTNGQLPAVYLDPQQNADSRALFCSAVQLINAGHTISSDGSGSFAS